jgi:hypothetical protein
MLGERLLRVSTRDSKLCGEAAVVAVHDSCGGFEVKERNTMPVRLQRIDGQRDRLSFLKMNQKENSCRRGSLERGTRIRVGCCRCGLAMPWLRSDEGFGSGVAKPPPA